MTRRLRSAVLPLLTSVLLLGMPPALLASSLRAGPTIAAIGSFVPDFDGDGVGDLVVPVPGEDLGPDTAAGGVHVIYGTSSGLGSAGNQFWSQESTDIEGDAEDGDLFGNAVTWGDFDGDTFIDLAVGVPFEDDGSTEDAGAVNVIYGTSSGLAATDDQIWGAADLGITGRALFGASVAGGNFNGDAYADLAIGAPVQTVGTTEDSGAVHVLYGSAAGLGSAGAQQWHQGVTDVPGDVGPDQFGVAVATGDFNGDAVSDLAIGAPTDSFAVEFGGAVNVLYGSVTGLSAAGAQIWTQNTPDVAGTAANSEDFGKALVAFNLGNTAHSDLAIGVPLDVVAGIEAGAVNVLYGSASGLTAVGDQIWHQNVNGIADAPEQGDAFGTTLATANLGKTNHGDLAVGVPGEDLTGGQNAGAVHVIYGTVNGLAADADQRFTQDTANVGDTAEPGDTFGNYLVAAHLGKTAGHRELAIGSPGEGLGGATAAGSVHVLYGTSSGTSANGSQRWTQNSSGILEAAENEDLFGAINSVPPATPPPPPTGQ